MNEFKSVVGATRSFWREFQDDDITGLAAECAFRFFLALFPFILFLVTLAAVTADLAGTEDPSGHVLDIFGNSLPAEASSLLESQVEEVVGSASIGLLSISFVSALWAAAGGAGALMKAVNRVYDLPETRRFWQKSALALGLTLLGAVTLISAVAAMMVTQTFAGAIASRVGLGHELGWVVQVLRLPLIVLFVMLAAQAIYWLSPDKRESLNFFSWGSSAFALGWSVFTLGFAIYVAKFGSYNATYGALAGVVILLFWFYVSSLLFLAGAELNWWLSQRGGSPVATPLELAAADSTALNAQRTRTRKSGRAMLALTFAGVFLWSLALRRRQR